MLVGGRSSVDLKMDLEKISKLFFPIKYSTQKEKYNQVSVTVKRSLRESDTAICYRT